MKDSRSPYLRSAAGQPVAWHEWGEEAFARARAEDKPILLDIGAVWCHWCHVIDRESYENPEIAAIINRLFVPIKVDRDERPDIDARYQSAIGALAGQGGWPLTAFLTPDGRPFYGGTYFPPEDAMGRPGMKRVLGAVGKAWQGRRGEIESTAGALAEAVAKAEVVGDGRGRVNPAAMDAMVEQMTQLFDFQNGGFGQAPKFPHTAAIDLILERYQATGQALLLTVAETTLEKMARGGVYDQIGGGFHRYSVDERWHVPHFEKMSYDNSELLRNYLHGYQATRKPLFRATAEGILAWTGEVLSDGDGGGFFASQDADISLDDDGDYFTWTSDEIRRAVSAEEARALELYYGVGAAGEMHHNPAKNVLRAAIEPAEAARELGVTEAEFTETLTRARVKLLGARLARPTPQIDRTIYTGWNAMMVSGWLEAAHALGRPDCRAFALKTLDRLIAEAWRDDDGFAHFLGAPRTAGLLDDHVFPGLALLDAFEDTLDRRYFDAARRTAIRLLEHFQDRQGGGFFDRPDDAPPLGGFDIRRKPFQDSPSPGANSAAAILCDRLFDYTGEAQWREAAERTLETFSGVAGQYGMFAASYGLALVVHARRPMEVVITGAEGDLAAYELQQAAYSVYRFGKAVLRVTPQAIAAGSLPAGLAETLGQLRAERAQALVCVENACQPPVADPKQLAELLVRAGSTRPAAG
ncbi:MAG TPA: thioredoxin domain-containing protein [Candidatus Acidoferrales bacterium]|nr:thioredoxin domain-containing protein [Candidatus Acidoferrales bacterium]